MKNTFRNGWTTAEEEEQFNFNNKHIEFEFFDKPSIYIFIRRFPRNLEIAVVSLLHMIKQKTTFTQIFQYFKKGVNEIVTVSKLISIRIGMKRYNFH